MEMTWPYIAGFFDGEGCIVCRSPRSYRSDEQGGSGQFIVTIYQTLPVGLATFTEMRSFLHARGIRAQIAQGHKATAVRRAIWVLRIGRRDDVKMFLTNLFPYLRIKRVLAADVIRFIRLYPDLTHNLTVRQKRPDVATSDLRADRQAGMPYYRIAEKYKLSTKAVRYRLLLESNHG